jgi:hypothetical protein
MMTKTSPAERRFKEEKKYVVGPTLAFSDQWYFRIPVFHQTIAKQIVYLSPFGVGPQHLSTQEEANAFFECFKDDAARSGEVMNKMNFYNGLRTALWCSLVYYRNMYFANFILSQPKEGPEDDINFNGRKALPIQWKCTDLAGINHPTNVLLDSVFREDILMIERELELGADPYQTMKVLGKTGGWFNAFEFQKWLMREHGHTSQILDVLEDWRAEKEKSQAEQNM